MTDDTAKIAALATDVSWLKERIAAIEKEQASFAEKFDQKISSLNAKMIGVLSALIVNLVLLVIALAFGVKVI